MRAGAQVRGPKGLGTMVGCRGLAWGPQGTEAHLRWALPLTALGESACQLAAVIRGEKSTSKLPRCGGWGIKPWLV